MQNAWIGEVSIINSVVVVLLGVCIAVQDCLIHVDCRYNCMNCTSNSTSTSFEIIQSQSLAFTKKSGLYN